MVLCSELGFFRLKENIRLTLREREVVFIQLNFFVQIKTQWAKSGTSAIIVLCTKGFIILETVMLIPTGTISFASAKYLLVNW